MWEGALLEHGWALALGVLVIGAVLATRGSGRWRAVVVGLSVVLAAGVVALDQLIETGREAMRASARRLVAGVTSGNATASGAELDPQARLFSYMHRDGVGRDEIRRQVEQKLRGGEWTVRDPAILEVQAAQDGPDVGRVQVKVRVITEATGTPLFSWWTLDYRLDGAWRAIRVEPLAISFVPDSRAR